MPKVSQLKVVRTVPVAFVDATVNVTYRLGSINVKLGDWLTEHGNDRGSLVEWTTRVVASWDLTDDADQIVPVTAEAIDREDIPTPFLSMVMNAVYADLTPSKLGGSLTPAM